MLLFIAPLALLLFFRDSYILKLCCTFLSVWRGGAARKIRYFHIGVLCFVASEYQLWTVGCFWPDTSPASPTFWCDMLLTLAIFGLLPAARKAVDA